MHPTSRQYSFYELPWLDQVLQSCLIVGYRCTKKCWFMIQGDVFCFTKLEEALIEVNFVIEAVHEDLEDKKSLLESKTIITQQFFNS